jgi:two-component system chemotaxis sensor kinase CheA
MTEWSGKQQSTLPEEVIARFRVASLERLERLEASWVQLTADPSDAATSAGIAHELHTLKGEARMIGFTDVDMVAHKLEDVLEVARERNFQISDDIDLVVTMALRFMTMLIRKKVGQTLGGIDLPGFVRQIDGVVGDARRHHPLRGRVSTSPIAKLDANRELLSGNVRDRFAGVAFDLFLELSSGRESRRLRRAWTQLRDSLAPPDPKRIAPMFAKHEQGAAELARDLGKEVELTFELDAEARAPT